MYDCNDGKSGPLKQIETKTLKLTIIYFEIDGEMNQGTSGSTWKVIYWLMCGTKVCTFKYGGIIQGL